MNITTAYTDARITKTGYETNRKENKYGEFAGNETFLFNDDKMDRIEPIKEETKKTATKRVKLSEMSDSELKEYYKKKEEEIERRERIKREIQQEKGIKRIIYNDVPERVIRYDKIELKDIPLLIVCIIICAIIAVFCL